MPKYIQINTDARVTADGLTLDGLKWSAKRLELCYTIDGSSDKLSIYFDSETIVKIMDEFILSTENENSLSEGIVGNHFLYEMEGSMFLEHVPETFQISNKTVFHFRLVTSEACIDVAARSEPVLKIASA